MDINKEGNNQLIMIIDTIRKRKGQDIILQSLKYKIYNIKTTIGTRNQLKFDMSIPDNQYITKRPDRFSTFNMLKGNDTKNTLPRIQEDNNLFILKEPTLKAQIVKDKTENIAITTLNMNNLKEKCPQDQ